MNSPEENSQKSTSERIIAAAESLLKRGEKVTGQNVRKELGGMSFSTITPVLRQWREQQQKAQISISELPENIRESSQKFIASLYQVCLDEAGQDNLRIKAQHKEEVDDLRSENDDMASEILILEEKITEAINNHLIATEKLSSAESEQTKLKIKIARLEERSISLSRELSEYKDMAVTLSKKKHDLITESSLMKAKLESQQQEITKQQDTISSLMKDISKIENSCDNWKQNHDLIQKEIDLLAKKNKDLSINLQKYKSENSVLRETHSHKDMTIKTLEKTLSEQGKTLKNYESTKNELATSKKMIEKLKKEVMFVPSKK